LTADAASKRRRRIVFTSHAPALRDRNHAHFSRRLAAPACAIAMAVLLAGNVAAIELVREDDGPLATPRPNPVLDSGWLLPFKLATTAGYHVLVYG
jgi:hypothetical protein